MRISFIASVSVILVYPQTIITLTKYSNRILLSDELYQSLDGAVVFMVTMSTSLATSRVEIAAANLLWPVYWSLFLLLNFSGSGCSSQ